ncbi:HAMP domain-containing sensor histidine kinase [uncultured Microbulbifer sp.]|uniref:sensor histidine kinase n=1 Tax=uncultured Microbulbifer sp. TaxID=348147 RepID=UPI00260CC11A|nr:HAMP domain-containing sensor histidine kinase [uncultured Microbulbifer sp.]
MLKQLVFRPLWLLCLTMGAIVMIALIAVVLRASLNLNRYESIKNNLAHLTALQETGIDVQEHIIQALDDKTRISPDTKAKIHKDIDYLLSLGWHLNEETPAHLKRIQVAFDALEAQPREALLLMLGEMESITKREFRAHIALVEVLHNETVNEVNMSLFIIVMLALTIGLVTFFVRRKVAAPLSNLSQLMSVLAERDYQLAETEQIEPIILPIFERYNKMVGRLQQLELAQREKQENLETRVQIATKAIVEQQLTLANSERLAYVGEISAQIAHELRNPLSSIKAVVRNVSIEVDDDDAKRRLALVDGELNRISELLRNLLNLAQHKPEKPTRINVSQSIRDLVDLAVYSIPNQIRLEFTGDDPVYFSLPEDRFRQVVLNLILNSAQAIGDKDGHITVHIKVRKNFLLEIEVCDDGPGFSTGDRNTRVLAFSSEKRHGTGLGLAIVLRFAHEFGGTLKISENYPKGSKVTVVVRHDISVS